MYEFHAFIEELGNVGLGQIGTAEAFVANALLCIFSGVDIDVVFGSVQKMGHANIQQVFEVFRRFASACNKEIQCMAIVQTKRPKYSQRLLTTHLCSASHLNLWTFHMMQSI